MDFLPRSIAEFPGTRWILTGKESDSESGKKTPYVGEGREVDKGETNSGEKTVLFEIKRRDEQEIRPTRPTGHHRGRVCRTRYLYTAKR